MEDRSHNNSNSIGFSFNNIKRAAERCKSKYKSTSIIIKFYCLIFLFYSTSRIINLVMCWKWCLNTKQKWTIEATTIPTLLVFLSTTLKRPLNDVKVNTIALQLWNLCHHILLVLKERNILPTQKESITFTHEPETNIYLCRRKMFWEV